MGLYHTIHIGAAIKIPTQKEKYIGKEKKCNCKTHYTSDKFCSSCGVEIKEIKVEKEQTLWSEDLIGSDNFFHHFEGDDTYFFSNFGHGSIENEENKIVPINKEIIDKCIFSFIEKHEKDIEILSKKTKLKIDVDFYFLHDYS